MVLRSLRLLTIGMLVVAGIFAFPAKTSARGEGEFPNLNVPQTWQNRDTGYCLGVTGGRMVDGTPVIVWPCNGSPDQEWITVSGGAPNETWSRMENFADPKKCLSVAGASSYDGARLIIRPCWVSADLHAQAFDFYRGELPGAGFYTFGAWLWECVGVAGGSYTTGASVIQWPCLPTHGDQEWYPSVVG
jgi:hypothetical protein